MINSFQAFNFRNLSESEVDLNADICLLIGANGSGKTSFLEAIYTLANGKSFRSNQTSSIANIQSSLKEFIVRGQCFQNGNEIAIGLRKGVEEKFIAKVNGQRIGAISELARIIPTQIVEPKSFHFFSLGAGTRRRFFDWGLFHVEQSYAEAWKQYINCLKQRNSLLRSGKLDRALYEPWDAMLVQACNQVQNLRKAYFGEFSPILKEYLSRCLPASLVEQVDVKYQAGWDSSLEFSDALNASWERDIKKRSTQVGAHRSDLRFSVKGLPFDQSLSRGQQKLAILCSHMAAISLVNKQGGQKAVLLLDDISSELDEGNLGLVLSELCSLDTQVIISGIDKELFKRVLEEVELFSRVRMFHVEHGDVRQTDHINIP
jgi:DNA replication and repair protein RecF